MKPKKPAPEQQVVLSSAVMVSERESAEHRAYVHITLTYRLVHAIGAK